MDYTTDEALTAIFDKHKNTVYRIAMNKMKSPDLADDISQEVFIRLVQNAGKLKNDLHVKAWLILTTQNCCKKYFDSSWSKKVVSFDDALKKSDSGDDYDSDYDSLPELVKPDDPGEYNDNRDRVYSAVCDLPDSLQEVIHLYYYEEYSVKEIADMLNIREGAVKTRMSRARNTLKQQLAGLIL